MPDPLDIRTGQPLDYEQLPRFVRPIRSDNIARIFGDPDHLIDLYRSREEAERIDRIVEDLRRDARVERWQRGVMLFIAATLALIGCIVAFNIGRGTGL